jgi:hypothetical protein
VRLQPAAAPRRGLLPWGAGLPTLRAAALSAAPDAALPSPPPLRPPRRQLPAPPLPPPLSPPAGCVGHLPPRHRGPLRRPKSPTAFRNPFTQQDGDTTSQFSTRLNTRIAYQNGRIK